MPKGTVPGRRREELSADCQRDFLGVCARQVCNPGLKHILIPIVPYSITFDSLCIFALAEILSKQFVQTSWLCDSEILRFYLILVVQSFLPWLSLTFCLPSSSPRQTTAREADDAASHAESEPAKEVMKSNDLRTHGYSRSHGFESDFPNWLIPCWARSIVLARAEEWRGLAHRTYGQMPLLALEICHSFTSLEWYFPTDHMIEASQSHQWSRKLASASWSCSCFWKILAGTRTGEYIEGFDVIPLARPGSIPTCCMQVQGRHLQYVSSF